MHLTRSGSFAFFAIFQLVVLILVVETSNSLKPTELACGNHFFYFQDSCYRISPYFDVWDNAEAFCQSQGAEIASNVPLYSPELTRFGVDLKSKLFWVKKAEPSVTGGSRKCTAWNGDTNIASILMDCESRLPTVCRRPMWAFDGACPNHFFGAGDMCYRVFASVRDRVTVTEATQRCKNTVVGGALAEMKHEAQLSAIVSWMEGRADVDVIVKLSSDLMARMKKRLPFSQWLTGNTRRVLGMRSVVPGATSFAVSSDSYGYVCMAGRDGKRIPSSLNRMSFSGSWTRGKCEEGFVSYGARSNLCLRLPDSFEQKSWLDARQFCRNLGSDLVSVASEMEQANVHLLRLVSLYDLWLGMKDGAWSDRTESGFSNFQKPSEGCGAITMNGEWRSENCSLQLPFICGKRLSPAVEVIDVTRKCVFGDDSLIQFQRFCYKILPKMRLSYDAAKKHCCSSFKFEDLAVRDKKALDQYTDRKCLGHVLEVDSSKELAYILQVMQSKLRPQSVNQFRGLWIVKTDNYRGWPSPKKASAKRSGTCTVSFMNGEWEERPCNELHYFICKTPTVPSGKQKDNNPIGDPGNGSLKAHVLTLAICFSFLFAFIVVCVTAFLYRRLTRPTLRQSTAPGYTSDIAEPPKTMSQLAEEGIPESGVMEDVYEEMIETPEEERDRRESN